MAPGDVINAESVARAVAALPAALFVGDVSGPLNEEVTVLADKLDPKLEEIKADMDATLELCHHGNEPSAGRLKDNIDAVRTGVRSIQAMATSLLNGTYVTPPARERLHRQASLSSSRNALISGSVGEQGKRSAGQDLVLEL
ncbi:unnamed protein product [Ascophyllum nodosum]